MRVKRAIERIGKQDAHSYTPTGNGATTTFSSATVPFCRSSQLMVALFHSEKQSE